MRPGGLPVSHSEGQGEGETAPRVAIPTGWEGGPCTWPVAWQVVCGSHGLTSRTGLLVTSPFPCACWPSVGHRWRNIYSRFLPIFPLGDVRFCYSAIGVPYITSHQMYGLQITSPRSSVAFSFLLTASFVVQKLFSLTSLFFAFAA